MFSVIFTFNLTGPTDTCTADGIRSEDQNQSKEMYFMRFLRFQFFFSAKSSEIAKKDSNWSRDV